MKLRDLTDDQVKKLKGYFNSDYMQWLKRQKAQGVPTEEQTARHFFSRGISAILDMEIKK